MKAVLLFVFSMLLTMVVTYAFAAETMLACTQADGSLVYTNKDVKGCKVLVTPELSVVPSYPISKVATLEPLILNKELSPLTETDESEVVNKTCSLWQEWVTINDRHRGNHYFKTVEEQQRRDTLSMLFGSGFSPTMCVHHK